VPSYRRLAITVTALGALLATGALAGCGNGSKGGEKIAVTATDTECQVAKTELTAGGYTFTVRNNGTKVTEFYVYGKGDKVLGEVEDISPGVTRDLNVDLSAGEYQAACKPGMKGNGIRVKLTVTGQAGNQ
jgi:iron uptake system component EfeO